jgi:cell division protein FtsB
LRQKLAPGRLRPFPLGIAMPLRRLIATAYVLVFAGLFALAGGYFWKSHLEYSRQRTLEAQVSQRLDVANAELLRQQKILERLRTDPAYVAMIIRRRLGYAKADELIFHFEDGN